MAIRVRTGSTAVGVSWFALMIAVHAALVVVFVAGCAAERRGIIRCVALVARIPFVLEPVFGAAIDRESCGSIHIVRGTERRCRGPRCLRMAGEAVMAEIHRRMIGRARCARVIALMALVAIGICQLVIPANMAAEAGHRGVRAG